MGFILKHKIPHLKRTFFLFLVLFLSTACQKDYSQDYPYSQPINIADGLETGLVEEVGLDKALLSTASGRLDNGKYGQIHSMLIYKNGKLVFEDYFDGNSYQWDGPAHKGEYVKWSRESQHCIHSDTKSFISLCIGIALDKGFIRSVEQSIFDYLPEYIQYKKDGKEKITIEHLLTMTSGLEWEEWDISLGSIENDQIAVWFNKDGPINYVLRKSLVAEPGTRFNYSGGDIQLLAKILENASGMNLHDFSSKFIFEPMNISSFEWWLIFPSGEIQAAGGLKMTPRDMVKIGVMMLDGGKWDGKQIVPSSWVEKCKSSYSENIKVPGEDLGKLGYSYTWWTKTLNYNQEIIDMFLALGWGGQKIIVIPKLNMVIVFTGANYTSNVRNLKIMKKFIFKDLI